MALAERTIAQAIRDERRARGWSQKDLADRIGTHYRTVQDWEREEADPSWPYMLKLAEVFGWELGFLYSAAGEVEPNRSYPDRPIYVRFSVPVLA